ncbi:hypothetical protein CEE45_11010 [Candidatus Heimdallarchaeota archaeon B3_Heim]|nr:MAG: hypothetical protein CEE45_11010 [Candidatus Heimdallarchaeota archaeon B3_Heim]
MTKEINNEEEAMEQTDSKISSIHAPSELNGIDQVPPDTDPTTSIEKEWGCSWCDASFDTLKSLSGHVLGKSRHDTIHDYQEFREHYADELKIAPKTKKKAKAVSGSTVVRLKPIETEFLPDEEQEISELKRETAILKERLAQKNISDRLGVPEREQESQRAFFEEERQREDILKAKDREIENLHKRMEDELKRNHEKELAQIRSSHKTDIELIKIQQDFKLEMQKLKTEITKDVSDFKTEMDRTMVKGVNTFVDLIVEDFRDKKAARKQTAEQRQQLRESVTSTGDQGILAILERDSPQIIKES